MHKFSKDTWAVLIKLDDWIATNRKDKAMQHVCYSEMKKLFLKPKFKSKNSVVIKQGGQTFCPEGRIRDCLANRGLDTVRFT